VLRSLDNLLETLAQRPVILTEEPCFF